MNSRSSSVQAPPPVGAYAKAMLCAITRRTPCSLAAAIRFAVPSRRRRLVGSNCCSILRGSIGSGMAVSWLTITSGRAAPTASFTEAASSASMGADSEERLAATTS